MVFILPQLHACIQKESKLTRREWDPALQCFVAVRKEPHLSQVTALCEACLVTVQQPQLSGLQQCFLQQLAQVQCTTGQVEQLFAQLDELDRFWASENKGVG